MSVPAAIIVVGDAGLDLVAHPGGPIPHGGDVRAKMRLTGGGSGANTALWLASLGAEPTLIARIGNDPGGRLLRAELEAAGVRCAFAVDERAATCCVVVLVDPDGQRSMLADRGANARFSPDDIDREVLAGAAHLHLSGYVLLDPTSRAAGLAALAGAKAAGLTTSVDPQAATLITDPAAFLDDVRGVDLLLPNTEELLALTGSSDPLAAKELLATVGAVAVTAGLNGASWVDGDGVTTVPAVSAECIDSTGAGDVAGRRVHSGLSAGRGAAGREGRQPGRGAALAARRLSRR
jgi:sugar/nucleoside kinase (ribokinase family)